MSELKDERVAWKLAQAQKLLGTQEGTKLLQRAVGQPETGSLTEHCIVQLNSANQDALLFRVCTMLHARTLAWEGTSNQHDAWTDQALTVQDSQGLKERVHEILVSQRNR